MPAPAKMLPVLTVRVSCVRVEPNPAPDAAAIGAFVQIHWEPGSDELGLDSCDKNAILRALAAGAFEALEDCGHQHSQHAN